MAKTEKLLKQLQGRLKKNCKVMFDEIGRPSYCPTGTDCESKACWYWESRAVLRLFEQYCRENRIMVVPEEVALEYENILESVELVEKIVEESLRGRVISTFTEYGGWWRVEGMAEWLDVDVEDVRKVYDALEVEGLMDRERDA